MVNFGTDGEIWEFGKFWEFSKKLKLRRCTSQPQ